MDPKNNDPLTPDDSPPNSSDFSNPSEASESAESAESVESSESSGFSEKSKSSNSSEKTESFESAESAESAGKKPPEDRKPHWDELGRGTSSIPKGAAEILKSYFDNQQINQAEEYHSFFSSWRDLAGLDLASHSSPKDIRNNTLIVDADHPGWVQMIYMKKKTILKNIRSRFPLLDINDLRVLYTSPPDTTGPDPSKIVPDSPGTSPDRKPEANTEKHIEDEPPEAVPFSHRDSMPRLVGGEKTPEHPPYRQVQPQKVEKEKSEEKAPDPEDRSAKGDRLKEALKRLGKHIDK